MEPLVVVSLVGMALVCGGTALVVFLMIARRFGGTAIAFFTSMLNTTREEEEDDRGGVYTTPKPDLDTIARRADFDAAVAKHRINDEVAPKRRTGSSLPSPRESGTFPNNTANIPAQSSPPFDAADASALRRRNERPNRNSPYNREHGDDEDDIIGGLMDMGDL